MHFKMNVPFQFFKIFFDLPFFPVLVQNFNLFQVTISANVMFHLDKLTMLLDTNFPTNLFEVLLVSQKFKSDVVSMFAVVSKFLCAGPLE